MNTRTAPANWNDTTELTTDGLTVAHNIAAIPNTDAPALPLIDGLPVAVWNVETMLQALRAGIGRPTPQCHVERGQGD